jgi:hypothetical protein
MNTQQKESLKLIGIGMLTATLVAAAVTLTVQLLWNYVLVAVIPAVGPVSFWQSAGLLLLSSLLFRNVAVKPNSNSNS